MTFTEIVPAIRSLSKEDRIKVAQYLMDGLAQDQCLATLEPGFTYKAWSQYGSYEAAALLEQYLAEQQTTS